jgi:glutathione S-transferase
VPNVPVEIIGAPGSPYSRKMRSLLRYRRIDHHWRVRGSRDCPPDPDVPVALIPILIFPDGKAMVDSSFQIRKLESLYEGRSVIPEDPGVAFLDYLIEDYADEWLTKPMFHYRWAYQADIEKSASILPRWSKIDAPEDKIQQLSKIFASRQIGRLGVVGSNEQTGALIETSYRRLLRALDTRLSNDPFIMGSRPGTCDFGIFGQLTQLVLFDPTPAAVALEESPRVFAWCDIMEDLSGIEPRDADWVDRDAAAQKLGGLLTEIGRYYTPFLLGNADALERGADRVECTIDGEKWTQKPFPYQGKCLRWLREAHAALTDGDRAWVDGVLAGTGCEALLAR